MKILQVTTFYSPVIGGVETLLTNLCQELAASGVSTEILTTNSDHNGRKLINVSATEYINGIKVTRVNSWFSLSEFHKFAPGFWKQLWKLDYDLIQVHGIRKFEGYLALLIGKLRHKKVIVTTHNPFNAVYSSRKLRLILKLHDWTFGKLFMRFFDHYQVISETEIPKLAKFGIPPAKISFIPNAVSRIFFENNNSATDLGNIEPELNQRIQVKNWKGIVLGVGRINQVKGFQYLQEAVQQNPEVLFVIAGGDDGYLSTLRELYQHNENIYFTGKYHSQHDLQLLYKASDIFVMPSIHEPFGIVLLEAMASGCAVIATKFGGPVEILETKDGSAGYLIDPTDQNQTAEVIKSLVFDPEKLANFKRLALSRVQAYSWDKILPQYLELYQKQVRIAD